ncbi:hypothetical protein BO99DRAFT_190401 [Aspergillus violaceofuscus CBS 115571]|uniref:Uncharacterized protein n=1 Tax=Aspergillus violaceofuscus (strain CBS 115571) TaxID=1450538 RepID=A0A2V5H9A9_ASPV1|nr:hypothetical protein BO99DRAFT_190401 [Aspergillus violaceofuscus CBS 115571]
MTTRPPISDHCPFWQSDDVKLQALVLISGYHIRVVFHSSVRGLRVARLLDVQDRQCASRSKRTFISD